LAPSEELGTGFYKNTSVVSSPERVISGVKKGLAPGRNNVPKGLAKVWTRALGSFHSPAMLSPDEIAANPPQAAGVEHLARPFDLLRVTMKRPGVTEQR
jgi:hypothetical protein